MGQKNTASPQGVLRVLGRPWGRKDAAVHSGSVPSLTELTINLMAMCTRSPR